MMLSRPFTSLLFLPASSTKILNSALKLGPSSIPSAFILDLEDSVPLAQKAVARENAIKVLEDVKHGRWLKSNAEMWVRMNAVGSGEECEDLKAVVGSDERNDEVETFDAFWFS
jgi:citrate lyase beta subunit